MTSKQVFKYIDEDFDKIEKLAKDIWSSPELAFEEEYAVDLQKQLLDDKDIKIVSNIGNLKTAFYAEYGNGEPVIGMLGEYDALPNMSQKCSTTKEPREEGKPGHACGHNLIGAAAIGSFLALKKVMKENALKGTIRYYACPAEEHLGGKCFMVKDNAFDDVDLVLAWHPHYANGVVDFSTTAITTVEFTFKGMSAHSATAPHAGRSALDAVELMNVGSNYLREHVIEQARIHYVITNGGSAFNIVPDEASVYYGIRAPKMEQVDGIFERIKKIANGAAMMTETDVTYDVKYTFYDYLPNYTLNTIIQKNMDDIRADYTKEDQEYIDGLLNTVTKQQVDQGIRNLGLKKDCIKDNMYVGSQRIGVKGLCTAGATDVGNVSYAVPTGQFLTACAPIGIEAHTWQSTSSYGSSIGMKGMKIASKTFAGTVYDLLTEKSDMIWKIKEEFEEDTKDLAVK